MAGRATFLTPVGRQNASSSEDDILTSDSRMASLCGHSAGRCSEGSDQGSHLPLTTKQVLEGSPFQDIVNGPLERAPEHSQGTIDIADTGLPLTDMRLAEIVSEETLA